MHSFKIRLLAIPFAAALALATTASAQDAFAASDANGDGALDSAEFVTFINIAAKAGRGQAKKVAANNMYGRAFARVDKNQDGRIAPGEVAALQ
ncbi:hypothetical protein HFC70_24410 [Agrobacterium sp. a22-2]|uniref:hypothetical protein n=1 Tax=Agrobacterium sp. a22-2 TaxID=2283840 RepID=UPI0014481406|nr:hypothetical protein [Agrobacterium sp. a22-2]NKN39495.1 hypothetical protein [Agrobacterium sp. a22-2]